jgi:hypothetical protein
VAALMQVAPFAHYLIKTAFKRWKMVYSLFCIFVTGGIRSQLLVLNCGMKSICFNIISSSSVWDAPLEKVWRVCVMETKLFVLEHFETS